MRKADLPLLCSVISNADDARALSEEWESLADDADAGPFARPLFSLTWWEHLGAGALHIVTVRDGGRLVALAPLHVRRVGPVQVVRWLGHGLGTVAQAMVLPGHDDAAALMWREAGGRGRVLDLIESHEHGPLPSASSVRSRHQLSIEPRDVCPVIDVHGDAEAHLADPRCKRVRRTVRVAHRRMEEAGHRYSVRIAEDAATLAELLPAVRTIFDAAEADRPRQHLLAGEWDDFTTALITDGVPSGRFLVLVSFLDETPLAFDLAFLSGTTISSWVGHYHPDHTAFSPGHLLQCAGLDWAAANGYTRIDLLLGDSFYKRLWATGDYRTLDVVSGSRSARALLRRVSELRARLGR